jgi:cysteine desulfuration protein SufE
MTADIKKKEIREMFEIFDDPMDKYLQIIELGKKNLGMPPKYKNEKNRIFGCASMAWVKVKKNKTIYNILIDSDTFIVKGLLSILKYIVDGATSKEINDLQIKYILYDIGLEDSITSQRTNGFLNALKKIKEQING